MSKAKTFFNEMLVGINDYQTFADFCAIHQLWHPDESGIHWEGDNYFLKRMIEYTDSKCGDKCNHWRMEREALLTEMRSSSDQSRINRIYIKWRAMIGDFKRIDGLPLFDVISEHLYQMISFNGKGGLWLDPSWTVLINPKFLTDLDLIPEPIGRIVFTDADRIPMFIVGHTFGIVSQNGIVFSDPDFDTCRILKFLALWESGDVVKIGNELKPSLDFCHNMEEAKSYHQGRVTKVRTHWRMQRRGQGRKFSQRKLIWEHSMRLPDKRADIQSHLGEAV